MDELPSIDSKYLLEFLIDLLNTPSPTGFTDKATNLVQGELETFSELTFSKTRKGALVATWLGEKSDSPRALTAHIDTLGAMVKEIKSNGRLRLTRLGSLIWNAVETEGCTIFNRRGETFRGSLLVTKASSHVYGEDVEKTKRNEENMEVRLDIRSEAESETRSYGIEVGDFVAFDPRVEVNHGFIRSRHLDDKACVACILAAVKSINERGLKPSQKTFLHISNFEEVGHGAASGIPQEVTELIAVDMAAVGEGQNSDEFHVSLCAKDSYGPYHHALNQHLIQLAEKHRIPYKIDTYPHYASDGEAFLFSGGDVAVGLIGPGVDASHNYERTHMDALMATTQWIMAYLLS